MSARLRVPTYLQAGTDAGGPARVDWLAAQESLGDAPPRVALDVVLQGLGGP